LRALGNVLGLTGFDFDTVEEVRAAALPHGVDSSRLSNRTDAALSREQANGATNGALERIADVAIYHADALVRRAPSLHLTAASRVANVIGLPAALFDQLGLKEGDAVRVRQGDRQVQAGATRDASLAETAVRVSAGTTLGAALGGLFGTLVVEKA
jgi:NADH-quinone oxidoreductase subunit G